MSASRESELFRRAVSRGITTSSLAAPVGVRTQREGRQDCRHLRAGNELQRYEIPLASGRLVRGAAGRGVEFREDGARPLPNLRNVGAASGGAHLHTENRSRLETIVAPSNFARESKEAFDMTSATTRSTGVAPHEHEEGAITKTIESVTSMVPSGTYLSLAIGAIGLAAVLHVSGRKEDSQFVGHWVPTILMLGLYNKIVKLHGSD